MRYWLYPLLFLAALLILPGDNGWLRAMQWQAAGRTIGLSSETKPSTAQEGSRYTESDTGVKWVWSSGGWGIVSSAVKFLRDDLTWGTISGGGGGWPWTTSDLQGWGDPRYMPSGAGPWASASHDNSSHSTAYTPQSWASINIDARPPWASINNRLTNYQGTGSYTTPGSSNLVNYWMSGTAVSKLDSAHCTQCHGGYTVKTGITQSNSAWNTIVEQVVIAALAGNNLTMNVPHTFRIQYKSASWATIGGTITQRVRWGTSGQVTMVGPAMVTFQPAIAARTLTGTVLTCTVSQITPGSNTASFFCEMQVSGSAPTFTWGTFPAWNSFGAKIEVTTQWSTLLNRVENNHGSVIYEHEVN